MLVFAILVEAMAVMLTIKIWGLGLRACGLRVQVSGLGIVTAAIRNSASAHVWETKWCGASAPQSPDAS